ncbi:hypothetical protein C8Q79DRAFT_582562 [Trametes meyenii]|nr:hypothetical protein C8Q79DRAFT_582562 [Trametes meyenii]
MTLALDVMPLRRRGNESTPGSSVRPGLIYTIRVHFCGMPMQIERTQTTACRLAASMQSHKAQVMSNTATHHLVLWKSLICIKESLIPPQAPQFTLLLLSYSAKPLLQTTPQPPASVNMRFSTLVAFATAIVLVSATPSPAPAHVLVTRSGDGSVELAKRSGCGSTGPLGTGHFEWFIDADCTPGAPMTCQATDASGCEPGKTNKIGSMEVDDPNDTFQIAKKSKTNTLPFVCPAGGQVRCQANFNDRNDGPNYSLRVF